MNSHDRVLMALSHKKPDRVPYNFWMDRRLLQEYEHRYGHRHWRVTHCGADVIETFPNLNFPTGPYVEHDGTEWQTGPSFEDWQHVDEIPLPDPYDDGVYKSIKADLDEFPDKALFLDMVTPWGVIAGMRTYEKIYMDMYEYPEQFHSLSRKILDVQKIVVERVCKMGITALYLMEDLATSKGLSMSPAMIREFCFDYARELIVIAHSHNIPVLFHSDGMVSDLVPILMEYGVCAMNPLQPSVNDAAIFKKQYGKNMAVYGGLDNCFIIPNGSAQDVRNHVRSVFDSLGSDGALIFSTHDIPIQTPAANIEAMIVAIQSCVY
jgi:uroporphyrinogen decarboxylase